MEERHPSAKHFVESYSDEHGRTHIVEWESCSCTRAIETLDIALSNASYREILEAFGRDQDAAERAIIAMGYERSLDSPGKRISSWVRNGLQQVRPTGTPSL